MTVPNYTPPTLAEMRTVLQRTLRDEGGVVFSTDALNDFINEGLADLDGYRPIEFVEMLAYAPDLDGTDPQILIIPETVSYIWQIEVRNPDVPEDINQSMFLPYITPESWPSRTGWDLYYQRVRLGRVLWAQLFSWAKAAQTPLEFLLWGYRDRLFPAGDGDLLDLYDTTDFLCLVKTGRMLGFQMLANDRSLYQQWLAATNNTDVSPTQLMSMLGNAQSEVDRARKRNALLRRTVTQGPQYI